MNAPKWTAGDLGQLRKTWGKVPLEEICQVIGRSKDAVRSKALQLGLGSAKPGVRRYRYKWTEKEKSTLEQYWAKLPPSQIAKMLGRGTDGVRRQAVKMGLGLRIRQVDGISANELYRVIAHETSNDCLRFFQHNGLKVHRQPTDGKQTRAWVDYKTFWAWARKHVGLINFRLFERGLLGPEPKWMEEARLKAAGRIPPRRWTPGEEKKLRMEIQAQAFTGSELAAMHGRTEKGIQAKLRQMVIPYRPLPDAQPREWTKKDVERLEDLHSRGWHKDAIARELGRSTASIETKIQKMRRRESA